MPAPDRPTPSRTGAAPSRAATTLAGGRAVAGPANPRRWWILATLCTSLLVVVIDNTIVNTALPTLQRSLGASGSQLQWIVDAYSLVFAGLLIVAGSLGDRFGRHRSLAAGLTVFGLGSLLGAFAQSPEQLIAMRALMGAGAAFVMPATLSILTDVFTEPGERAAAIGIWGGVSGLGIAIGPTTGGLLLEHFAWGSVFLINLPIVAAAIVAGRILVPASRAAVARRLDPVGAALSIVGLVALTWTVIEAPVHGWTSSTTLAAGAVSVAVLGAFAAWELRSDHPMLELGVFSNRRFTAASISVTLVFFSLMGSLFLLTQNLQFVLGYSTLRAGLGALPFALTVGAVSPVAAVLAKRVGTKLPVAGGLALMGVGLLVMSRATVDSGYGLLCLATVVMAAGMGLAMAPATESIMGSLPQSKAGVGSAINDTTRELGGVLGVAIVGSLAASIYSTEVGPTTVGLPAQAAGTARDSLGGALAVGHGVGGAQGAAVIDAAQRAFILAADRGMVLAAAAAFAGAVLALRWLPAHEAVEGTVHVTDPAWAMGADQAETAAAAA